MMMCSQSLLEVTVKCYYSYNQLVQATYIFTPSPQLVGRIGNIYNWNFQFLMDVFISQLHR